MSNDHSIERLVTIFYFLRLLHTFKTRGELRQAKERIAWLTTHGHLERDQPSEPVPVVDRQDDRRHPSAPSSPRVNAEIVSSVASAVRREAMMAARAPFAVQESSLPESDVPAVSSASLITKNKQLTYANNCVYIYIFYIHI